MYIEKIKVAETVAANWKNTKFEGLEVAGRHDRVTRML